MTILTMSLRNQVGRERLQFRAHALTTHGRLRHN